MWVHHSFLPELVFGVCLLLMAVAAWGAVEDLGNGFSHYGVATPVSNHRGTVATVDGGGRNVVLVWLFDHRGGYAILMIDAETGRSEQIEMPFDAGGDCPYASVLSGDNKFYTHFNSYFTEFDPVRREFTFAHKTAPQMAMGMTEDDEGVIWSVTYPDSGVVSFDPKTRELRDYGHVYKQGWKQYQRYVATDDKGWVYFGLGMTASQIVALNRETGEATALLAEDERVKGSAYVYRDRDGKAYGTVSDKVRDDWYVFYEGKGRRIGEHTVNAKPIITQNQNLFHRQFPDGKVLKSCDLGERTLAVEDPQANTVSTQAFDYASEGAHVMSVQVAPNGTICGGTAFPMRFFSYDPKTDAWVNRPSYAQWNTVAMQGKCLYAGAYGHGVLQEWDPERPWVQTVKGQAGCNPQFVTDSHPDINRPHALLAHPDGRTLILAGTPDYGYTGGGVLFWDQQTRERVLVKHTDILENHSTMSLAALPEGKLLGGTTTSAGTGGEKRVDQAELYIMDMASKAIEWHGVVFEGAQQYTDLCPAKGRLVYGFVDQKRFFVFDAAARKVVREQDTKREFGSTNFQQGPRVFVRSPAGRTYILFEKGVALIDPDSFEITMPATSPVPIGPGGDFFDGKIYFASGSHIYSYAVPE